MSALRPILALTVREWRTTFGSPLAWAAVAGFVALGGLAFFQRVLDFQDRVARMAALAEIAGGERLLATVDLDVVVVQGTARALLLLLVFVVPLLAMRTFAEDRARGVEEWLLSAPVGPSGIVLGKAIALAVVVVAAVATSAAFPAVLLRYGNPDPGAIVSAWSGLALAGLALCGPALACSACARSQGVAAIVAIVLGLGLFLLDAPARAAGGWLRPWLEAVALPSRFEAASRGVIEAGDVAYFVALGLGGLAVARAALSLRRWS